MYIVLLVCARVDEWVDESRAPEEYGRCDVQPREVVAGRHWVEEVHETRGSEADKVGRADEHQGAGETLLTTTRVATDVAVALERRARAVGHVGRVHDATDLSPGSVNLKK